MFTLEKNKLQSLQIILSMTDYIRALAVFKVASIFATRNVSNSGVVDPAAPEPVLPLSIFRDICDYEGIIWKRYLNGDR